MAFTDAPQIDEPIWSTKNGTPVYYDPRVTAEKVQSNYQSDQSFHEFRKGDQIGKLLDNGIIRDDAGNEFFKVQVWQWKRTGIKFLGSYEPYQEFFEAYVRVDHEPEYWIRESRKDSYQQAQQKDTTDADVTGYISGLRGVPQPTDITKDDDGTIRLTFANGYKTTFKELKNLSSDAVRTLTTEDKTKKVATTLTPDKATGSGVGTGTGSGSILTKNMLLLGAAALSLFGLFIFLTLRKK